VVDELYRRRGEAFTAGSAEALDGVFLAGGPSGQADTDHLASLSAEGEVLRGFAPTVVEVTAFQVDGDRAELDLADRWPDYSVVAAGDPDGPVLRAVAGRGDASVRLVLMRTAAGWRIESGQRIS
jgi:hypothetical protein